MPTLSPLVSLRVCASAALVFALAVVALACGPRSAERVVEGVGARVAAHEIERSLDQRDREKAHKEAEAKARKRHEEDAPQSDAGPYGRGLTTDDGR